MKSKDSDLPGVSTLKVFGKNGILGFMKKSLLKIQASTIYNLGDFWWRKASIWKLGVRPD